jgi:hypothetical protein
MHRMTDNSDKNDLENTVQQPSSPSRMKSFHQFLEINAERALRNLFFWETDDKKLGTLIRFLHHSVVYITLITYIIIHTVMPSYILLVLLYGFIVLVWIHHIICGGCLSSKIEQKLIGDSTSFVDPILESFHIPITTESTVGITIMGSTLLVVLLTFELTSRTILNVRQWIPF